ncbi:hypothetical protein B9Z55_002356 [Caenorhabditis nigoni]|uniref:Uncharacterized protein n=1 Tax=Caenorhabditis nigoni TaxID=1611254 RepID=A0A2G5VK52_9PELO|nr:hypothetical protein B9Z55_002356 [Caenorhabditis nigoni]
MGACEKADMDKKVMCCPGKIHAIVLGIIFFLSSLVFAGLLYWQLDKWIPFFEKIYENDNKKPDFDLQMLWCVMAIPGVMFLSAIFLIAIIKINPKILLLIGIAWPVLSSGVPAYASYHIASQFKNMSDSMTPESSLDFINSFELYILYIVPVSTVVYIICAIYCIVLLVCLGCCQRAGAGRDFYDFEAESDDDDNEVISESRISIE